MTPTLKVISLQLVLISYVGPALAVIDTSAYAYHRKFELLSLTARP